MGREFLLSDLHDDRSIVRGAWLHHHRCRGPSRVNTAMIANADHMYTGEEARVAETIAKWADTIAPRR